ncbi:hypothetical protein [Streptomyces sp. NPDC097610]|uniref:hypothetical protein n=1 Tax=Streptomyces sp. NPDC097610 TaxID=3157227 RepID=UPI00332DE26A
MADPIPVKGGGGPSPSHAYTDAPDLLQEATELTRLAERLRIEATVASLGGQPYELDELQERLYLLRWAALSDRLALAYPDAEQFVIDATQTAHRLATFDRAHGTHRGLIGPGANGWAHSHRSYVRQEYGHWIAST